MKLQGNIEHPWKQTISLIFILPGVKIKKFTVNFFCCTNHGNPQTTMLQIGSFF